MYHSEFDPRTRQVVTWWQFGKRIFRIRVRPLKFVAAIR